MSAQLRAELLMCRICSTCCGGIRPAKLAGCGHDGMSRQSAPTTFLPLKVYSNGCSNTTVRNHHRRYRERHGAIFSAWLSKYTFLRCNRDVDDLQASAGTLIPHAVIAFTPQMCSSESLELGRASTCSSNWYMASIRHYPRDCAPSYKRPRSEKC